MMKRNYFGKLLAIAMIFAGFSLTSCDENDNAIVNGEVWVKPEVQLVDGGAIITGSSTADINRMLGRVRQEIMKAANDGEKFTIDIQTPVLNSTADDNTLNIAAVTGGDIVLNLPSNIVTEVPLMIQAMGVTDDALPALSTNEVEINIPSGASNVDLQLNMPTSTVTLKGGTIDELVAVTAINTLVIESGVTVNWLKMKGCRAIVNDGAKVLGYLFDGDEQEGYNYDAYAYKEGVRPDWGSYFPGVIYPIVDGEPMKPYYAKNIRIIKGEKAKLARVRIENAGAENDVEMIIADGAAAGLTLYGTTIEGTWTLPQVAVKGEGNKTAKIYSGGIPNKNTDEEENISYSGDIDLEYVKELSNVIVDLTTYPDYPEWNGEEYEYSEVEISWGSLWIPESSSDCDFISPESIYGKSVVDYKMSKVTNCNLTCATKLENVNTRIQRVSVNNSILTADNITDIYGDCENCTFKASYVKFENLYVKGNSSTVKNCKFVTSEKNPSGSIYLPYQTTDRKQFDFNLEACEFSKGFMLGTYFATWKPWYNEDGKQVTHSYHWYVLEDDGETPKLDDNGNRIEKRAEKEDDVPEANKNNGYENYYNGYWGDWDTLPDRAYYNDYLANIKINNSKIDGKVITKDTDFISYVGSGTNEKGEIGTTTRFIIDGISYKALQDTDTKKYILIAIE